MTEPETSTDSQPQTQPGWVDLSDLKLMPAWVGDFGKEEKIKQRYSDEGGDDRPRRDGPGGFRGERRGGGGGGGFGDRGRGGPPPRRDGPGGGGGGFAGARDQRGPGGGFRPRGEGGPGPRRDGDDRRGPPRRFGDRDRGGPPQREWVEIPRDVQITIYPDEKAVDALAAHVRQSGHAFSMFDAARLVLAGGDRFMVRYRCAEERPAGLFSVPADGSLFLTRDEALAHVLRSTALDEFYRAEDVELEAPKGEFASVAVCGMSGEIIAPPSHHSYQTGLMRLHRERFSNMQFEDFKRRVRVEANPELVAKWKENMSKGRRWVCLKGETPEGGEPMALNSRADMEAHFRRTFGNDAVVEVREAVIHGNIDKNKLSHVLFILLRQSVDAARKHLFEISQKLGAGLERRGLKLFKRRAGKQYVCRMKPRAIDPGMVFSDRLSQIVEILKGSQGMPMQKLVESIVPSPAAEEGAAPDAPKHPTDEQINVIKDIRWLANEGYVIEYSDGMVFLGVQGEPQKEPAAKKGKDTPAAAEPVKTEESTTDTDADVATAAATHTEQGAEVDAAREETGPASALEPEKPVTEPAIEPVVEPETVPPVEPEVEPAVTPEPEAPVTEPSTPAPAKTEASASADDLPAPPELVAEPPSEEDNQRTV
ncbi:MAG: hypothetical protein ACO1TE_05220 [Prosthecobacter sp.]